MCSCVSRCGRGRGCECGRVEEKFVGDWEGWLGWEWVGCVEGCVEGYLRVAGWGCWRGEEEEIVGERGGRGVIVWLGEYGFQALEVGGCEVFPEWGWCWVNCLGEFDGFDLRLLGVGHLEELCQL